ncbi:Uncharacterised protein [Mycobacteroides abscessus subsp. abscessus]|nr:Uncharacterised protein [Mycobacteroides abscessus subsp. abscessus]
MEKVGGGREGGPPCALNQASVPTAMVQMQVSVDDDIDGFGRVSGLFETGQVVGIEHVEVREQRPVLVITRAGVDHDDGVSELDDVVVDRKDEFGAIVGYGGRCVVGPCEYELLFGESRIPVMRLDGPHIQFGELSDGCVADGESPHSRGKHLARGEYSLQGAMPRHTRSAVARTLAARMS